jgi:hypothetical protein
MTGTVHVEIRTYPDRLLGTARNLIDSGEPSISVVVAHMACEVATARALTVAFEKNEIGYLEDAVGEFLSGYSLSNERLRKLYTALTGDAIQKEKFWERFKTSAGRRNSIAHYGDIVDAAAAEDTLAIAKDYVAHVVKVTEALRKT